ncbi:MAG: hypothetical protein ACRENS_10725, partial [Candidatus Eiseniibacteriota bacterium]
MLVTAVMLMLGIRSARAAWPTDPTANFAICTAAHDQINPRVISDGAGGAIFTWQDIRTDNITADIYAQRVNAGGATVWTGDGVLVSGAVQDQVNPAIIPDGSGGAIICWVDFREGFITQIYGQRINSAGVAQWTGNGVAISTGTLGKVNPALASDGAGGAFVVWQQATSPSPTYDVYAQHVTSTGAIASGWAL